MATVARRSGVIVAAVSSALALALALVACGGADGSAGRAVDGGSLAVGLLLPDNLGRWEGFDRPSVEQAVRGLCEGCTVETVNAQGDVGTQQQQVDSLITRGFDSLILIPIDAKAISASVERAREAGIPVVSYDRLAEGPVSAYVSFDNEQVGRLQGRALLHALGGRAERSTIVMMNGDPSDPNAGEFRRGALEILSGRVEIGESFDTFRWNRERAYTNMAGAIVDLGPDRVHGVLAANDSIASGVVAALNAAGFDPPLPPVTGQDAELSAIRLILREQQYMTVYKPFQLEAGAAAEMALALARGESLRSIADETVANDTRPDIPAVLATPISVTADTIDETVVRDGLYTIDQICAPEEVAAACARAGLTGPSAG
ncbi:sugar ABC transporter substrate-binding protein [Streptomyces sp. 6N223]|uniref:sugar ABC transporter substrate-binding protein n=1 Tax=Streptomyces sp. 6N223 TaxID=3457412 RepID=UPI003FD14DDB